MWKSLWKPSQLVYRTIGLFLASLSVCIILSNGLPGTGNRLVAQSISPLAQAPIAPAQIPLAQLVQQGVEQYDQGNYVRATQLWQQALQQSQQQRLAPQDIALIHSNLGQAYRQTGNLTAAINQWEVALKLYRAQKPSDRPANQTAQWQLLTQQAQAYSELGQHSRAITLLEPIVRVDGKPVPNSPNSIENQLMLIAAKGLSSQLAAIAWGALGKAYLGTGDYDKAIVAHTRSMELGRSVGSPIAIANALNNLGNAYLGRANRRLVQLNTACAGGDPIARMLALGAYQDAAQAASYFQSARLEGNSVGGLVAARALLNSTRLETQLFLLNPRDLDARYQRILTLVASAPNSQDKAYALINLAASATPTSRRRDGIRLVDVWQFQGQRSSQATNVCGTLAELRQTHRSPYLPNTGFAYQTLQQAIAVADAIGDRRSESYALGAFAGLYQIALQSYDRALQLTQQAQNLAQQVNATDSLYRWQWQAGRLYQQKGDLPQAILAYRQAIASLQSIRSDILTARQDIQYDFRDDVEPIYRELIELLLDQLPRQVASSRFQISGEGQRTQDAGQRTKDEQQKVLSDVLSILESLKLAELQNFFGDDCVQVAQEAVAEESVRPDPNAVIIYSVVLPKRLELIVRSPAGTLTRHAITISQTDLEQTVDRLRLTLVDRDTSLAGYRQQAQQVYDVLVRPLEADLAVNKPQTLVFVHDSVLRKLPMAALHDGEQTLIEKYAIATTPSYTLTTQTPLKRDNLQALILGLTVAKNPFGALRFVKSETTDVQRILGGTTLLDNDFTLANLQARVQKTGYPIVHMATHGKFGADADSTFLLAFDQTINIGELDNILRLRPRPQTVELLTLSACQTAAGDNRSALGIAGVALRTGVKSAVATLWSVNDATTATLISEFYTQLKQNPTLTKAEALRQAQIKLINSSTTDYPYYWAPFTLIGNWL